MAIKKYIGARYAPKFMGAWDKASEYAALSVVYTNEQSYVSRKTVPANTEITNTEFWIKSADWNAQVTQYNQNVEQYNQNVERYNQNVETYSANVDNFFYATIHAYNTKEEMVNDTTIQPEYTLITCGANAVGDNGGSMYKVTSSTSATAVALKNGLFAVPFTIETGAIAGTALTFNGKSNATAVWNVKAPGTVSIPLSVNAGSTATVFLAVLYGARQSSVVATLYVNGNTHQMTFTDAGDATHDKIVVYSITVKNLDTLYYGSATSASWTVDYTYDTVTKTAELGTTPPLEPNTTSYIIPETEFQLNAKKTFTITKIKFKTNHKAVAQTDNLRIFSITEYVNGNIEHKFDYNTEIPANTVITLNPNVTIEKGHEYKLLFALAPESGTGLTFDAWDSTIGASGDFGEFTLQSTGSGYGLNAVIEYNTKK